MSSINSLPNLVQYYFIYIKYETDLSIAFLKNIHSKIKLLKHHIFTKIQLCAGNNQEKQHLNGISPKCYESLKS